MISEQVQKTPAEDWVEIKADTGLPTFNSRRKYVYGARKYTFLKASRDAPRELQDIEIILFDDAHNLDIACDKKKFSDQDTISVDEYIINIIKYWEKKFVIDLFIETEKNILEMGTHTNYIQPLVEKLSSCLLFEKSECPYNNLRAHWTDNRLEIFAFEKFKIFWNAFLSIYWLGFQVTLSKPIDRTMYDYVYENVQIYLRGNEDELVIHPDWMSKMDNSLEGLYLLDTFKIKKQIDNIEIKTVREELLRMVEMNQLEFNNEIKKKERENLFLTIHECLIEFAVDHQNFKGGKKIGNTRYIDGSIKIYLSPIFIPKFEQYFNLFKSTMDFISPFIDLYLLARLFRTYKTPGRGRSAGDMARRIIIIAGWYHTDIYWNFFHKMGITEIMDTQETRLDLHAECLDLKREDLIPFTPLKSVSSTFTRVEENFYV